MTRTQVQLTGEQLTALRRLSAVTGKSIAELVRNGIDQYLAAQHLPKPEERIERALRIAGKFASGRQDVGSDHDRYLAEDFHR
jgi:hypothetical protein